MYNRGIIEDNVKLYIKYSYNTCLNHTTATYLSLFVPLIA